MSDRITVRSSLRDYSVNFVDVSKQPVRANIGSGDIVIVDRKVMEYFGEVLALDHGVTLLEIDATETAKEFRALAPVIEKLLSSGFRKGNALLAIGGGVVQDIVSFVASIMFRGVEWRFYPTTLLAQCDSCIGGKTSINFGSYKNQLGNFNPPSEIYIDLKFLKRLPRNEIRSGLGEILHYCLVAGETDCAFFEREYDLAFHDVLSLRRLIERSLSIKKRIIEIDEFDRKERRVFNYGHSFGHAIETLTDYAIPHGIAVSLGMELANRISRDLGYLTDAGYERMRPIILRNIENDWPGGLSVEQFVDVLRKDKKSTRKQINVILTKGPGHMFVSPLELTPLVKKTMAGFLNKGSYE